MEHFTQRAIQAGSGARMSAKARLLSSVAMLIGVTTLYEVVCFDSRGREKWRDSFENLVVTAGRNHLLDVAFKSGSQITTWYVGLTGASPTFAAADTMSSHAGWTESETYSEGNRQTLTLGTVSAGSVDNSASKATYSINGSATLGGAFLTSNNTKGGTTGTLYGGGAFSGGNRSVVSGDTVQVTATLSITSS